MKKLLLFIAFTSVLLSLSHGAEKRKHQLRLSGVEKEKSSSMITIPLKRRTLSKDSKEKVFNFLSESQTTLKHRLSKGEVFLEKEKLQMKTRESHHIKLSNYQNTQFTGFIALTNSSNTFAAIFDTGSANTWLNSVDCSDVGCLNHKQYNPTTSNTFTSTGLLLEVEFGTGTLSGEICSENIYFGDVEIDNQNFAKIENELGAIFAESKFDAIVGLAYPSMAAYGLQPVFDGIMAQKRLDQNVFSFYFDKTQDKDFSQLSLGGVDPTLITEAVVYFPVTDKFYWMIEAETILINGVDYKLCNGGCKIVVDTGTSFITGPSNSLMTVIDLLDVDMDCSNLNSLPNITYVLKGGSEDPKLAGSGQNKELTLTPQDYVLQGSPQLGAGCVSGIMPLDVPEPRGPLWILGDIFLAKYVSVYDRDNDVVGFAAAKPGMIQN